MPRLLIKSSQVPGQWIELKAGVNRLGRSPTNDFCFDDPTVSGRHCEISVVDDSVSVRDCGSTNGTLINGQTVTASTLLPGQILKLGEIELVLDAAPIIVAIPRLDSQAQPAPAFLPDGSETCLNHAASPAVYRCKQCQRVFCLSCVHRLRRVGGSALTLCPNCSGQCERISSKVPPQPKKNVVVTLMEKTLKLGFKRKKR
jgi:FHA domain-containing protein